MNIPTYWKSGLEDIDNIIKTVSKAKVTVSYSAGGRKIYLLEYGMPNKYNRLANYSSACGARDNLASYADKSGEDIRPCVFLVGSVHGAECEGVSAILNLISLFETGKDLAGRENELLSNSINKVNYVIIPCVNPDGRMRFPRQSAVGMSLPDFRYYAQGTWKDKSLCNWPDCKKVHPILEYCDYLGAYYNDDGINLMHDNFNFPMAEETKLLLKAADKYVPDITVLFHGCANARSEILIPNGVHPYFKDKAYEISEVLSLKCNSEQIPFTLSKPRYGYDEPIHNTNLVSVITSVCGELCITYESNQGLSECENQLSYDMIDRQHTLFLETLHEFAVSGKL